LQSLDAALQLASTNPDSVSWNIWSNVDGGENNVGTATRRDEGPRNIDQPDVANLANLQHCASGECTKPELSNLKFGLQTAVLPNYIWDLLGLMGKWNFGYRFKYDFNEDETGPP
jgi:hypothetical protein